MLSTKIEFWFSLLAKDVRTGCPDTPSDGFVSHGSKNQAIALFLGSLAYLLLCVKALLYNVRNSALLFNGGKTFWLVMMSSRWWQSHHHLAGGCQRLWEVTCHRSCPFALQAAERGLWQIVGDDSARLARYNQ